MLICINIDTILNYIKFEISNSIDVYLHLGLYLYYILDEICILFVW